MVYSFADNGNTVSTSPVAGEDVYAFLQIFLDRFPKYAHTPFHIAAESYGGMYGPIIASVIFRENEARSVAPIAGVENINLASLVPANG
jgi:cathepsin A (carboxypeptidase C)